MSVANISTRASTCATWRAAVERAAPTKAQRVFLLEVLLPTLRRYGQFAYKGIGALQKAYAWVRGREIYTQRHILRLLRECTDLGLIREIISPAPGRHAAYEAVIPGQGPSRPMIVRRRGIRPKRLLAAWRSENPREGTYGRQNGLQQGETPHEGTGRRAGEHELDQESVERPARRMGWRTIPRDHHKNG